MEDCQAKMDPELFQLKFLQPLLAVQISEIILQILLQITAKQKLELGKLKYHYVQKQLT